MYHLNINCFFEWFGFGRDRDKQNLIRKSALKFFGAGLGVWLF
ncbi:hypothetical protein X474_03440 [Dethiosulfatarculus sandiegensis]|uniref:Uncharacterized protein n=1 Tax=Dethiosulfatarculus sandiegensis TaxID=1429043 RepID=A0A0D2JB81_9BACT|nr:hypothetical protein X474_03440 [Dethiosulfatarculus sandiegensis]